MHAADQVAEPADLGRRVEPAHERIGEIEVACERRRADARRERTDARGGQRPLVRERDAARRRERAELAKRGGGPFEGGLVAELRLDEERDQDRADAQLGGPRDRDAHVLGRRRGRPCVARADAAEVVLVEHEGRDL